MYFGNITRYLLISILIIAQTLQDKFLLLQLNAEFRNIILNILSDGCVSLTHISYLCRYICSQFFNAHRCFPIFCLTGIALYQIGDLRFK